MSHPSPTHATRIFLFLALLAGSFLLPQAQAQLAIQLKTSKNEIVAYETAKVQLSITNRASRTILLARPGGAGDPWIGFEVVREGRDIIQPVGRLRDATPVQIRPGQTIVRNIDIARLYPLSRFGMYSIKAQVWTPPDAAWAVSNAVRINVVNAKTLWSDAFGVPMGSEGGGTSRIYKVMRYNSLRGAALYFRLDDRRTGMVLACYPLGKLMDTRDPMILLDAGSNLHVLYKVDPETTIHAIINTSGKVTSRQQFHDQPGARPRLASDASGRVGVTGGILYDPEAEAQQRLTIHRLSEIPPPVAALVRGAPASTVKPLPDEGIPLP